jgi:hypothetical protein
MTPRDEQIILETFMHRFIRPSRLAALLAAPERKIKTRCRALWQHQYLERPKALRPVRFLVEELAYGLGRRGVDHLQHRIPILRGTSLEWVEEPRKQRGWPFLDHALAVTDVMVGFRLAAERLGMKLAWDGYFNRRRHRIGVTKHRPDGTTHETTQLADAYFILEHPRQGRFYHLLEVDRGNVSLKRMKARYQHYFEFWQQRWRREHSDKPFRVLTVTEDPQYLSSLRRVAQPIGRTKDYARTWGSLLFTSLGHFNLDAPEAILAAPVWFHADQDNPVKLIES